MKQSRLSDQQYLLLMFTRRMLFLGFVLLITTPLLSYAQTKEEGAVACLKCHDTQVNAAHAVQTKVDSPFTAETCESCHGESVEHSKGTKQPDGKRATPSIIFGTKSKTSFITAIEEQNKTCLGCHTSSKSIQWQGSQHQSADLTCSSCHSIHTPHDSVMDKITQADTCFTCHVNERAQSHRPSKHPMVDGKMTCSSCHNPHGSRSVASLVKNTINETCFQCHAEKRGPFLWEHQPVREDCTNCHAPHGAVQASMLKTRTPFLCTSCHSENFHPSTLRSGTGVPPAGADDFLLGKDCMNCHSQIHGSNHPAGTGLTR